MAFGSTSPTDWAAIASSSHRRNCVIGSAARSASARPPAVYSSRSACSRAVRSGSGAEVAMCGNLTPRPPPDPPTRGPRPRAQCPEAVETKESPMTEVQHGLEGVVAFETQIAEPDKEGSALRYRGVDIEDIVGRVPFENVWGLLIDGAYTPGLPPAEAYNIPVRTGDVRVDVQAAIAMLAPAFGFGQTYDISDSQAREDLARVAVMVLSYAAQPAGGPDGPAVARKETTTGPTLAAPFLIA